MLAQYIKHSNAYAYIFFKKQRQGLRRMKKRKNRLDLMPFSHNLVAYNTRLLLA